MARTKGWVDGAALALLDFEISKKKHTIIINGYCSSLVAVVVIKVNVNVYLSLVWSRVNTDLMLFKYGHNSMLFAYRINSTTNCVHYITDMLATNCVHYTTDTTDMLAGHLID